MATIDFTRLPEEALSRSREFLGGPAPTRRTLWHERVADGLAPAPAAWNGHLTARKWADIRRYLADTAADREWSPLVILDADHSGDGQGRRSGQNGGHSRQNFSGVLSTNFCRIRNLLTIQQDILVDIQDPRTLALRVETDRFGPFTFQVGLDQQALELALVRVEDAHQGFISSPLARVASQLEGEVLVESIHGTNTIEGADLTLQETGQILTLPPEQIKAERELRVRNIKAAYDLAHASAADRNWRLGVDFLRTVHVTLCRDLSEDDYRPGLIRANPKGRITYVGDRDHGGRYKPPQYGRDIERLLNGLVSWHDTLVEAGLPAILRAPLVHLYFERIHPFWDGNGRLGRVVEATLLMQGGIRYAPFALSGYYLAHIDHYFSLFNSCRRADEAGDANPNQAFAAFYLEGMRQTLVRLHNRVNRLVDLLLMDASLVAALERRQINPRQYTIVRRVLDYGQPLALSELRQGKDYLALYRDKTDKTKQRDLRRLREDGWLRVDVDGLLWPGFMAGPDDGVT